jgi:hypothetical protein
LSAAAAVAAQVGATAVIIAENGADESDEEIGCRTLAKYFLVAVIITAAIILGLRLY